MEIEKHLRTTNDELAAEMSARAAHVGALRQIASEMEGFLDEWVQRLKCALDQCRDAVEGEASTRGRTAEFEEQRRRWEAQRQRDLHQLGEEAQRLADAWLRVEAEQRRLLQAREALPMRTREGGTVQPTIMAPDSPEMSPASLRPVSLTESVVQGPSGSEDASSPWREMAVRQFEQLRREIGKHARGPR